MPIKPIRYEEDRTGTSPENLVLNERHTLQTRLRRIIVPLGGAFFTESMVIKDGVTGRTLVRDQDYYFADFVQTAQWVTGKEIAATVVIKNTAVSNTVELQSYQVLGGPMSINSAVLKQQIEQLDLDKRPVLWDKILGKPATFAPPEHMHDVGDTFGWEYIVYALDRIRAALEMGDEFSHQVIYDYIDAVIGDVDGRLLAKLTKFQEHIDDRNNPHGLTIDQLGGLSLSKANELIDAVKKLIQNHANNRNNPHGVTAHQVDAFTKAEVTRMLNELRSAITVLQRHANDRNNPHGITPGLIGTLTSVEINRLVNGVNSRLEQFMARRDNPNGVTAVQTGSLPANEIRDLSRKTLIVAKDETHLLRMALDRALFGRYHTGPRNQYLSDDLSTETPIDQAVIDRAIEWRFGKRIPKLREEVIPISTKPYNGLRWNGDGLYYGVAPPDLTRNLHVDAINGVDEAVTEENQRGTRAKPLKTVAFALSQGPGAVRRTILLMEGQEHLVGSFVKSWDVITGAAQWNRQTFDSRINHDHDHIRFRGGEVTFMPYGPKTDAIPHPIGNTKWIRREILNIGTKLVFQGWSVNSKTSNYTDGLWVNATSMQNDPSFGPVTVNLYGIGLERRMPNQTVFDKVMTQPNSDIASHTNIDSQDGLDITWNVVNCKINTGNRLTRLKNSQRVDVIWPMFDARNYQGKFLFRLSYMEPELITGMNPVWRVGNRQAQINPGVHDPDGTKNLRILETHVSNKDKDEYGWRWFSSTTYPPKLPAFDYAVKRGDAYFIRVPTQSGVEEVQVYPALWQ